MAKKKKLSLRIKFYIAVLAGLAAAGAITYHKVNHEILNLQAQQQISKKEAVRLQKELQIAKRSRKAKEITKYLKKIQKEMKKRQEEIEALEHEEKVIVKFKDIAETMQRSIDESLSILEKHGSLANEMSQKLDDFEKKFKALIKYKAMHASEYEAKYKKLEEEYDEYFHNENNGFGGYSLAGSIGTLWSSASFALDGTKIEGLPGFKEIEESEDEELSGLKENLQQFKEAKVTLQEYANFLLDLRERIKAMDRFTIKNRPYKE